MDHLTKKPQNGERCLKEIQSILAENDISPFEVRLRFFYKVKPKFIFQRMCQNGPSLSLLKYYSLIFFISLLNQFISLESSLLTYLSHYISTNLFNLSCTRVDWYPPCWPTYLTISQLISLISGVPEWTGILPVDLLISAWQCNSHSSFTRHDPDHWPGR